MRSRTPDRVHCIRSTRRVVGIELIHPGAVIPSQHIHSLTEGSIMKITTSGTTIKFTFDGLDPIEFDTTKPSAPCQEQARMAGWTDRLRDMAALSRTLPDGTVRTTFQHSGIRSLEFT